LSRILDIESHGACRDIGSTILCFISRRSIVKPTACLVALSVLIFTACAPKTTSSPALQAFRLDSRNSRVLTLANLKLYARTKGEGNPVDEKESEYVRMLMAQQADARFPTKFGPAVEITGAENLLYASNPGLDSGASLPEPLATFVRQKVDRKYAVLLFAWGFTRKQDNMAAEHAKAAAKGLLTLGMVDETPRDPTASGSMLVVEAESGKVLYRETPYYGLYKWNCLAWEASDPRCMERMGKIVGAVVP